MSDFCRAVKLFFVSIKVRNGWKPEICSASWATIRDLLVGLVVPIPMLPTVSMGKAALLLVLMVTVGYP